MPEEEKTFDNVPEADVVLKYINARFRIGLGTNIFIIGLSGTGKSSASIRIGELVIQSRTKEELKLFIVGSLIELLESIKQSKEGDIIVIEEVSVLFPSRRAMGSENLAIAKIFDTIRKKRLCLISNAPLWNSVDNHMKSMCHILIQTLNVYKTQGVVVSKFYRLQTEPSTGKIYRHTMTRKGKDVQRMITRMPNKERWTQYEKEKEDFMNNLYENLKQKQIKKEAKEKGEQKPVVDLRKVQLTAREREAYTYVRLKGLKQVEAAKEMGISANAVSLLLQKVDKKNKNAEEVGKLKLEA